MPLRLLVAYTVIVLAAVSISTSPESNTKVQTNDYDTPPSPLPESSDITHWLTAEQLSLVNSDDIGKFVILIGTIEEVANSFVVIGSIKCEITDPGFLNEFAKGDTGVVVGGYVGQTEGTVTLEKCFIMDWYISD